MSAITVNICRSRWGLHPCDHQTFLKLKELAREARKAQRQAAAWRRWQRKDPHNRVVRARVRNERGQVVGYQAPVPLPEPEVSPLFYEIGVQRSCYDKDGRYYKDGIDRKVLRPLRPPQSVCDDYRNARRPGASPGEVTPLGMTAGAIDRLYRSLK
jgi:hypothetical protein